ncbi:MAG TPA: methyltransferase domain-containing protein [Thermoanaerobaculia bacterium]
MPYWDDLYHHTAESLERHWMAHPLVREAINRRVTGDPQVWPVTVLGRHVGKALSIGSGAGAFERTLIELGIATDVTGVDVSDAILGEARKAATEAGMTINYVAADAREYMRERPATFDAVFFHASLHHFDQLDDLMATVKRALRPDGFLWYDEYVGPSRDEWTIAKLVAPNLAYYRLPRRMRRPKLVRAPINREDPTEAVASSGIVAATARHFRIAERHDYGGNLLFIVYPNLRQPHEGGLPRGEFDAWIAKLIEWDAAAMRRSPSWSTVIWARATD